MFRVVRSSQRAVYAELYGSKSSFHFLLRAQKKTKQKKRAPGTKPIFPSKRTIQPLWPAYPRASNVPRCSWMSPLQTPLEFLMMPKIKRPLQGRSLQNLLKYRVSYLRTLCREYALQTSPALFYLHRVRRIILTPSGQRTLLRSVLKRTSA